MNRDMTAGLLKQLKHADVMKAFVEGAEVQLRERSGLWYTISSPSWQTDVEYRVKPAEPIILYVRRDNLETQYPFTLKPNQYERLADDAKKAYVQFIEVQD